MKKKFQTLSRRSLVMALAVFVFTFFFYHYVTPDFSITLEFQQGPGKPLISELLSILGTMFLFAGILSGMIARIFFPEK